METWREKNEIQVKLFKKKKQHLFSVSCVRFHVCSYPENEKDVALGSPLVTCLPSICYSWTLTVCSDLWRFINSLTGAAFTWEPSALDLHHLSGHSRFQLSCFNHPIHHQDHTDGGRERVHLQTQDLTSNRQLLWLNAIRLLNSQRMTGTSCRCEQV